LVLGDGSGPVASPEQVKETAMRWPPIVPFAMLPLSEAADSMNQELSAAIRSDGINGLEEFWNHRCLAGPRYTMQ
jgi:hypothetical protein